MNREMRRVVADAESAARAGWSDQSLASLAESTRGLRCAAGDVERLLARPPADHGSREVVFTTDPLFHASVFALAEGERIPLHDHPGLDVITKVLRGRIRVRTYEWLDAESLLAIERGEVTLGEDDAALVLRKSPGTLHTITALDPTVFLDLFSPYYDEVERPCKYYAVGEPATGRPRDATVPDGIQLRVVSWEESRR